MIPRATHLRRLTVLLAEFPVAALLGARQVGKTTLARELTATWPGPSHRFDLEDPRDLARLEHPMLALDELHGLVVLDEIQRRPGLFEVLRVLADREGTPARFLVLGSASPSLLRQTSETLAGRIARHELGGLGLDEVGANRWRDLWLRGGFPRSFVAVDPQASARWRQEFVRTWLERDVASLGLRLPAETLRRFWTMLAHYHGQTWNAAELARAFGVAEKTVRRYLDLLCSTFMARRLPPFSTNVAKRQVKAPKVYLTDTGLMHSLLGLHTLDDLLGSPKVGASWEGFALAEVVAALGARPEECFHWKLHSGAKLDLLVTRGPVRMGFEFKFTDSPRATRSMHTARTALGLDEVLVIHAGSQAFPLADGIRAVPLTEVRAALPPLTPPR